MVKKGTKHTTIMYHHFVWGAVSPVLYETWQLCPDPVSRDESVMMITSDEIMDEILKLNENLENLLTCQIMNILISVEIIFLSIFNRKLIKLLKKKVTAVETQKEQPKIHNNFGFSLTLLFRTLHEKKNLKMHDT